MAEFSLSRKPKMKNSNQIMRKNGFSLIEMMVVVAIMGILFAIALPSYRDYVLQGRLVDGHSGLSSGRVRAEQFYQDFRTYENMPCPAATSNFTFACSGLTANTFLITANGQGAAAGFSMTVDQNNARATISAPSGWATPNNCWVVSKSSC